MRAGPHDKKSEDKPKESVDKPERERRLSKYEIKGEWTLEPERKSLKAHHENDVWQAAQLSQVSWRVGSWRGVGGHVQLAGRGKHAVGVCDDGEGARGRDDEGAGGAGGGGGGHVQRAGGGKLAVGGLCIFPSFRHLSRMAVCAYVCAATGVPE